MDTKHTPGPWFTNDAGYLIVGGENFLVARVTSYDDEETDANARLIAAAPQQHDALLAVLYAPGFESLDDATKNAVRAAIAKATGAKIP